MSLYIIAHDVGTGGNKAVLVDTEGNVRATAFAPYPVRYPRPDWAEQEPEDWWHAIVTTTRQVMERAEAAPGDILGVVHSTQLLGIVPMSNEGQPLRPAIIWLDGRAPDQARRIMTKFLGPRVFAAIAGTEIDPASPRYRVSTPCAPRHPKSPTACAAGRPWHFAPRSSPQ